MKPAVIAVALGGVAALAALGGRTNRDSVRGSIQNGTLPPALSAPCPPGTLPDEGVCVPVPATSRRSDRAALEGIPRRPDRDPDYARYELPVAALERPTVEANAGSLGPDGGAARPGVVVIAKVGAKVRAVSLEGQEGPATVVFSGPLIGSSLVTLHAVRNAGRRREYLLVLGNLAPSPGLAPRAELARGAIAGATTEAPLYFDVRLLRPDSDAWALPPGSLTDDAHSVSVDPRNVLERVP